MLISIVLFDWANNLLQAALLLIDQVIYWLASQCYQLFIKIAGTKLFEESFFARFANRIYVILGVFMLFYLAYALLTAIIDPEKLSKGDKGVSKIALNLVTSLVLLGFLPSIFSYAYRIQNLVLSRNIIGALILGTGINEGDSQQNMLKYGDVFSFSVLNTFLNPENENFQIANGYSWFNFKEDVLTKSDYSAMPSMSKAVSTGAPYITESGTTGQDIVITYMPFISAAAGIFLIYVMISFTLDLGIRVAKFAFYQLFAPIPVILRILPGKKGTFDKWLKQTLFVYFEVFVRVGIMYIAVYFINELSTNVDIFDQFFGAGTGIQGKLAFAVIMMGILAFAKEMPKKLSEILGIETGGLKLGIKDKLKAGGFFAGGAMLGAGATSLVNMTTGTGRNLSNNFKNSKLQFQNATTFGGKAKAIGSGLLGVGTGLVGGVGAIATGTTSGIFNAYKSGKDAKDFNDMKKAASAGAKVPIENREKRANYIASHGGVVGAMIGHTQDAVSNVSTWAGISPSIDSLKQKQERISGVSDSRKAVMDRAKFIRDTIEKGQRHVTFTYTDIHGNQNSFSNEELGYIRKEYESLKASGASAEELRNAELKLEAAETQANKDIINGLAKDGVSRVTNYDGELQANIIKLMTNINNAAGDLRDNISVDSNVPKFEQAAEFTRTNQNENIGKLAQNGTDVFGELIAPINAPTLDAKNTLQQHINREIEKKEKK